MGEKGVVGGERRRGKRNAKSTRGEGEGIGERDMIKGGRKERWVGRVNRA